MRIIGCVALSCLAPTSGGVFASAAGDFDPSFNRVGLTREVIPERSSSEGLALHHNDEIVTAGSFFDQFFNSYLVLWRHLSDGTLDSRFGGTGIIFPMTPPGFVGTGTSLAVDSQDRLVMVTIASFGSPPSANHVVYRFNFDGSPDLSFSATGNVTIPIGRRFYAVTHVVTQPDNKILAVGGGVNPGTGRWEFLVYRVQESGELDQSFGQSGRVWTQITPGGGDDRSTGVAIQPDGKIVVSGRARRNALSDWHFALARYLPNGQLDNGFGIGGKVMFSVLEDDLGRKVVIQPDGKIVIAGYACKERPGTTEYCYFGVARVDDRGNLDPSFGGTGKLLTDVGNGFPYDLALQEDNKIIALGIHGELTGSVLNSVLVRYLPDGSLDPTFGFNGISETNFGYVLSVAAFLRLQSDGQIVVAGSTFSSGGTLSSVTARYQSETEDLNTTGNSKNHSELIAPVP
jgi:uncharacterized delta-60 repeat protein